MTYTKMLPCLWFKSSIQADDFQFTIYRIWNELNVGLWKKKKKKKIHLKEKSLELTPVIRQIFNINAIHACCKINLNNRSPFFMSLALFYLNLTEWMETKNLHKYLET